MPALPDLILAASILVACLIGTPLLGAYMAHVLGGERTLLSPVVGPVERGIYRVAGVKPDVEQGWIGYAVSLIAFSVVSIAVVYLFQRLHASLPLNPTGAANV